MCAAYREKPSCRRGLQRAHMAQRWYWCHLAGGKLRVLSSGTPRWPLGILTQGWAPWGYGPFLRSSASGITHSVVSESAPCWVSTGVGSGHCLRHLSLDCSTNPGPNRAQLPGTPSPPTHTHSSQLSRYCILAMAQAWLLVVSPGHCFPLLPPTLVTPPSR